MATKLTNYRVKSEGFDEGISNFEKLGEAGERAFRRIDGAGKELKGLDAINAKLREGEAELGRFDGAIGGVESSLVGKLGARSVAIGAATAGVAAVAVGLAVMTRAAIDNAAVVGSNAERIGLSARRYQELAFAAKQARVDQETLNGSLGAFATNVGKAAQGVGPLAANLEKVDRALLTNIQRAPTTEAALDLVLRKIAATTRETDRVALANAAFGESGVRLLPILSQGEEGLSRAADEAHRLGLILSDEAVAGASSANAAIAKLSDVVQTNLTSALITAAPYIESTAIKLANLTARVAEFLSGRTAGTLPLTPEIDAINAAIANVERELDKSPSTGFDKYREGLVGRILNLQKERDALLEVFQTERNRAAAAKAADGERARATQELSGLYETLDKRQQTAIERIQQRRDAELASLTRNAAILNTPQEEIEKRRVQIVAQAEAEIAKERKKGSSAADKAAREYERDQERIAKALTDLENDRLSTGLEGVEKIREEERQRFVELEKLLTDAHASEEQFNTLREESARVTAARITEFEKKEAEERAKEAEKAAAKQQRELDKAAEEQQRVVLGIATDVSGLLASGIVEGFAIGKEAAFDWGDAVRGIIKRLAIDFAQALILQGIAGPLLGLPPSATGGNTSGSGLLSLLIGGGGVSGGGGLVGSAVGSGNGGGGLLSSLLRAGSTSSSGSPPSLGIPTILQKALFGGAAGGSVVFGGAELIAAMNAASAAAPLGITVPTSIGPAIGGFTANPISAAATSSATGPAAAGATSGASALAAYAGLALALGLGAKGISDTRSRYGDVTLGAAGSNSARNALTGIQGATIGIATGVGAGIGSVVPGIGTVIGAGVGAAVGAAVSDAVGNSVTGSIASGVQDGITQAQLEKRVVDDLTKNPLLIALGGLAHILASKVLGPAVTPNIESIFAKVFRGGIGGKGGLDTAGVTGPAPARLDYLRGDAGTASRLIAQAIGAGGDAFGQNREGRFVDILLGGIAKRQGKTGEDEVQLLAETFVGTWNGRFLDAMKSAISSRKGLREADAQFVAEQFSRAQSGFNYQTLADIILEDERVPGKPARKASREAVRGGVDAALGDPTDPRAFQRSVTGSFIESASGRVADQLVKTFGQLFAPVLSLDRDSRQDLRRAKRRGDFDTVVDILSDELRQNGEQLAKIASDPELAAGIGRLADEIFRAGVAASEAADDFAAVRGQIDQRLAPFVAQVNAIDQGARDVRSRTAFAIAGPGFAGSEAQIAELSRRREEAFFDFERQTGVSFDQLDETIAFLRSRGATRGITPSDSLFEGPQAPLGGYPDGVDAFTDKNFPQTAAAFKDAAEAQLAEYEAQIALERQKVDLLDQTVDAFRGARNQAQSILGTFDSRAEVSRTFALAQRDFAAARGRGFGDPVTIQKLLTSLPAAISTAAGRFQFYDQASRGFTALSDQLALATGGRRAGRRQLAARRAEIEGLIPTALANGPGQDDAVAKLQRLLPEALQLGQSVLAPGQLRKLQKQLGGTASSLGIALGGEADVAREQLTALEKLADQSKVGSGSALDQANEHLAELLAETKAFQAKAADAYAYLRGAAGEQLGDQIRDVVALLGTTAEDGSAFSYLRALADHFKIDLPGRAAGGPVAADQPYWVGERGVAELFVPERNGRILTAEQVRRSARGGAAAAQTIIHTGGAPLVVVQAPPGPMTSSQMSMWKRSTETALEASVVEILRKYGVAVRRAS